MVFEETVARLDLLLPKVTTKHAFLYETVFISYGIKLSDVQCVI